ncbi:T9SS type A sorting domain-containing protein [Rhizosphaericola mali]|uniref:T9SS type A sorting domain-containing protein n=1 Tax=Rhizosphaericola mali TaxID=2545455 RepID=A0A5P2G2U5_9BACT|nr:T9SS type A sorting domain-containing protein [Rhizosphaericola mali]QES88142.1 T9SS type A sorting domain-containing protein [Rhizosphaericola mali]
MYFVKKIAFIIFLLSFINNCFGQSDITISTTLTNPNCNGTASGSIVVTASGGSGIYQYELNESNAGGWQKSGTFNNLIAGTYPVSVKDANNNYKTIYVTLTDPTAVTANVTSTTASCQATNDATLTVTASGGAGSYNYSWSYGGTPISSTDTRFKNYNTSTITGPSGTYTISVTDKNSCSGAVKYYNASTIPLTSASFNQDVVVEKSAAFPVIKNGNNAYNVTSKLDNDGTGYVFFESGYPSNGSNTDGLPQNNTITSTQDNSLTYTLQSYSANNSARTSNGGSSTLQLATPAAYGKLLILGTSGSGSSTYSYSINFNDNTSYVGTLNNNAINYRDWYSSTGSDISLRNLNRVRLDATKQTGNNYSIFEAPIILPPSYFNKTINSITLTNTSSNTSARGNIFALSGFKANATSAIVGYAASGVTQPSVTISSTLDSSTNYYCKGQSITFTATTVHGGTAPTYLLEQSINGRAYTQVASNATSNTYSYTPADTTTTFSIRVTATASSDAGCLTNTTSNQTIYTVTQHAISPTVTSNGPTTICQGTNANYTVVNTTNGGNSPSFTWYDGSTSVGTGTSLNINNLTSGTHQIQVKMLSSISCASNNPIISTINTTVNTSPTPTITISNTNASIPITYAIASSSNLGTNPKYQWFLNNDSITGATSTTYTTSTTTSSGDIYSLRVTSSATCANPAIVMSNYRTVATALPIVLKSFIATAYSNNITLNWQTATEINTDRFEILRKYQDSSDFNTVGTVKATNNSSGSTYQFIDYPRFAGTYQYRLKNYDFDGNYQLSDIVSVYFGLNGANSTNKLYPNPFNDKLIINVNNTKSQSVNVIIYNMNGSIIQTKGIQLASGVQNFELTNLSNIPSGVYIIKIIDQSNNPIATFNAIKK